MDSEPDKQPENAVPSPEATNSEETLAEPAAAQPETKTGQVETASETGESEDSPAQPAGASREKKRRPSTRVARKNQPTLPQVTARFAACGRCSYFWAGYEVIQGKSELETAVAHSKSGWLELEWDQKMPELIHRTYGVRLDVGYFHYEACCKECRRHFVYKAAGREDEPTTFRIEITPRVSR